MPTAKVSNTGKAIACRQRGRRKGVCVEDHRGQPEPFIRRITISSLPDNVLLEIFDFYLHKFQWWRSVGAASGRRVPRYEDLWHTLVHVCCRWRSVVFASPRRLNLELFCTGNRPVKKNIWPELPIILHARIPTSGRSRSQHVKNIVATLRQQHNRICRMTIRDIPNSLLKTFASMKKTPFPALTDVIFHPPRESAPVVLDSFLGGSAPRLQSLRFDGIPFLALGKLLLSSRDLSELTLDNIPHSGYISPDVLVSSLSGLTRLRRLVLNFQSPRSRASRERRVPPLLTRVVLPALARFHFKGDSEYLEGMLSRMNPPSHVQFTITFFNQLVFDTPLLHNLINRAETFFTLDRAEISFSSDIVLVALKESGRIEVEILMLKILCKPSDWQLSSIAQVIGSSIPPLSTLERLVLREGHYRPQDWQDDIENAQWLEILRPFTSVKDLVLCGPLVRLVAPVLGELIGESVAEELPALQNIFVEGFLPSESHRSHPWQKEIAQFTTAREISGHPVAVHYQ